MLAKIENLIIITSHQTRVVIIQEIVELSTIEGTNTEDLLTISSNHNNNNTKITHHNSNQLSLHIISINNLTMPHLSMEKSK